MIDNNMTGYNMWDNILALFSKKRRYEIEYNKGIEAYQAGRFDQAIQLYYNAIAMSPEKTAAYYNLGLVYMSMGKNKEAEKNFLKVIELDSKDTDAYYNLGLLYLNTNRNEEALKQFLTILEIKPDDPDGLYTAGLVYMDFKNYNEAIPLLEKAVSQDNENAEYFMVLGQAYDQRSAITYNFQDIEYAMNAYKTSIKLNPDNEEVNYRLAICSAKKGLWEDCVKYCKNVLEINDMSERAYNQMGLAMYCGGDYEKAKSLYEKSIRINPNYAEAYSNYGYVLEKQGDFTQAIKMFKKYTTISQDEEAKKSIQEHIQELEDSIASKDQE